MADPANYASDFSSYTIITKRQPCEATLLYPSRMNEQPSPIQYPCEFPIKIMGKSHNDFVSNVVTIVKQHAPDFDETSMEIKASKNKAYLSITCTFHATSRTQLDALYLELHSHPMVAVVL